MFAHQSLVSAFETQVRETPEATALIDAATSYTYSELDRWADSVRAVLTKAAVEPGDVVGVNLPSGAAVVAAIVGVLKAGCAYVPLDPAYPVERLAFIVDDSCASAVLTAVGDSQFDPTAVEMPAPHGELVRASCPPIPSSQPAYVIYTSGSTGTPKGVVVTHGNVLSLLRGTTGLFTFGPTDTWSFFHSYSFDFSVWELWGSLLHGGKLVCVPEAARFLPSAFVDFLASTRVTVLNIVPSVFRHLLASLEGPQDELVPRYVIFGGEAVDSSSVSRWLSSRPAGRRPEMINMYGITETCVHVTHRRMTNEDLTRDGTGTLIGTALPHLEISLLGEDLKPVAPGEPGEIFVSGGGVSMGYLDRPELNEHRFPIITAPDSSTQRYFRSGDIASWDPTSRSLVYRGRLDDQVQFNGFRVELGEIENVLRSSPDVVDAAVVVTEDPGSSPLLVAYVVSVNRDEHVVSRIRGHARGFLPRHMVPRRVHTVDALPRTASGKLDRKGFRE